MIIKIGLCYKKMSHSCEETEDIFSFWDSVQRHTSYCTMYYVLLGGSWLSNICIVGFGGLEMKDNLDKPIFLILVLKADCIG